MDPINPLSGLAEILRKRMSVEAAGKGGQYAKASASAGTAGVRPSAESLRKRLQGAVAAIDPNDPNKRSKATRLFVESVLTWQFGEALLNDPRFNDLADEVQTVLESEPRLVDTLMSSVSADR